MTEGAVSCCPWCKRWVLDAALAFHRKKHGAHVPDYPVFFKRGTYVQRAKRVRLLTPGERERIPEAHRPAEGLEVERMEVTIRPLPKITAIQNRAGVLFRGEEIELKSVEG